MMEPLCNTLLITGPPGVGKTSTVYACAQELGFKVGAEQTSQSMWCDPEQCWLRFSPLSLWLRFSNIEPRFPA